jgi:hypothetical protein
MTDYSNNISKARQPTFGFLAYLVSSLGASAIYYVGSVAYLLSEGRWLAGGPNGFPNDIVITLLILTAIVAVVAAIPILVIIMIGRRWLIGSLPYWVFTSSFAAVVCSLLFGAAMKGPDYAFTALSAVAGIVFGTVYWSMTGRYYSGT